MWARFLSTRAAFFFFAGVQPAAFLCIAARPPARLLVAMSLFTLHYSDCWSRGTPTAPADGQPRPFLTPR